MSPERRKKEKLNRKPERKDLRRETLGVTRCLLEVSLLQREVSAPEYSKRKRCGSERAWDFSTAISLSLSLSLSLPLYSISLSLSRSPTLPSTPHLCGTLSA